MIEAVASHEFAFYHNIVTETAYIEDLLSDDALYDRWMRCESDCTLNEFVAAEIRGWERTIFCGNGATQWQWRDADRMPLFILDLQARYGLLGGADD